ncbi:MAG: YitT family protein [Bacteroidales bacterium]|nr:YitT family protein [Bacteroidales bacterium]MBP5518896.1 YitT family protein [Bacteroidales bacterium]
MNTRKILGGVKAYVIITIGLLCYVLGWCIFLIPNNLVGGGVSGISSIILYAFGVPISITYFSINIILLLIALKVLGKSFGVKTVYAIIATTLFFQFVPEFLPQDFINEIAISNGKLISAIFGGVMSGVGIGISFSQGGSTGGTDIVALMVAKYHNIAPGRMILYMDLVIIACSLLIPARQITDAAGNITTETWGMRLATVLYGYMLIASCSQIVDMMVAGSRQSVQVYIFSREYEKIADRITTEMGRGVTVLTGEGWYTRSENKMLLVLIHKTEVGKIHNLIREIDKDSFISMAPVTGVWGRGFQQISVK